MQPSSSDAGSELNMNARCWVLALPLLVASVQAQRPPVPSQPSPGSIPGSGNNPTDGGAINNVGSVLTVVVVSPDDHAMDEISLRVQLVASGGAPIADQFTHGNGRAQFSGVAPGTYHLQVSGMGVEDTSSDLFEITQTRQTEYVRVKLRSSASSASSAQASVSAQALEIPHQAGKELARGNEEMERQHWEQAEEHFRKAIAAWPAYGAAYNNLGLACARQKNYGCAREAWEKAVQFDPGSALPLLNLARLCTAEHEFNRTADLLQRASRLGPLDAQALVLLANADLMLGNLEQAVAHARQSLSRSRAEDRSSPPVLPLGGTPGTGLAADASVAHLIAGKALEAEQRPEEAAAEYRAVLRENSKGSAAESAQQALLRLQPPPAADGQ
jgi:tetratricopeptide (TPR) repeat protein